MRQALMLLVFFPFVLGTLTSGVALSTFAQARDEALRQEIAALKVEIAKLHERAGDSAKEVEALRHESNQLQANIGRLETSLAATKRESTLMPFGKLLGSGLLGSGLGALLTAVAKARFQRVATPATESTQADLVSITMTREQATAYAKRQRRNPDQPSARPAQAVNELAEVWADASRSAEANTTTTAVDMASQNMADDDATTPTWEPEENEETLLAWTHTLTY